MKTGKEKWAALVLGMAVVTLGGCNSIKDDLEDCPPYTQEVMIVTARDAGTGATITISDKVQDGSLFFFDGKDDKLVDYVAMAKTNLGVEKPIPVLASGKYKKGDMMWISAWGNIGDSNMNVTGLYDIGVDDISTEFLFLTPNPDYEGFYTVPQEILFGIRTIIFGEVVDPRYDKVVDNPDGTKKLVHEIQITQLNALLWVQVENLPDGYKAEDYYLQICNQNNGYNYQGDVFAGDELREMRGVGKIDARTGFLVSPAPRNLIPSLDPNNINEDNAVALHLFQVGDGTTRAGDIDLTGAVNRTTYGDGDYIGLYSGKTTNVLIRFPEGGPGKGDIEVYVEVTEWGVIHQWTTWGR